MNYFKKLSAKHVDFKKNLINQMVAYNPITSIRNCFQLNILHGMLQSIGSQNTNSDQQ